MIFGCTTFYPLPDFALGSAKHRVIMLGVGAAYGTAKSGIGIAGVGTFRPDLIMKVRRGRPSFLIVLLSFVETQTDLRNPVSDSRHHVRYPGRLLARHRSPHSRRSRCSVIEELQFIHVSRFEAVLSVLHTY